MWQKPCVDGRSTRRGRGLLKHGVLSFGYFGRWQKAFLLRFDAAALRCQYACEKVYAASRHLAPITRVIVAAATEVYTTRRPKQAHLALACIAKASSPQGGSCDVRANFGSCHGRCDSALLRRKSGCGAPRHDTSTSRCDAAQAERSFRKAIFNVELARLDDTACFASCVESRTHPASANGLRCHTGGYRANAPARKENARSDAKSNCQFLRP